MDDQEGSQSAVRKGQESYSERVHERQTRQIKEEKDPEVWKKRGWIWLKGAKTRLNLCSGAGDLGEIYHFYDVSNPNVFSPVRLNTPVNSLPETFFNTLTIPWDKSSESIKNAHYRFWHSFILDCFHDRSKRMQIEASPAALCFILNIRFEILIKCLVL